MMKSANSFSYKKLIYFLPLLVWMVVIFLFSAQVADESSALSEGITRRVAKAVSQVVPKRISIDVDVLETVIRKAAHFMEYMILGIFAFVALHKSELFVGRQIAVAIVFCMLYAISDEVHQAFVPGRACRVFDMLLDSVGASAGVLGVNWVIKYHRFRKEKSE